MQGGSRQQSGDLPPGEETAPEACSSTIVPDVCTLSIADYPLCIYNVTFHGTTREMRSDGHLESTKAEYCAGS